MAESTVDQVAAAIGYFEKGNSHRYFRQFHIEQARKFKRQLQEQINPETGKPLAKATIHSRLMALKAFFKWLAGQPGYKSRITYSDADHFNNSANDERIAKAVRERPVPSVEQIRHALLAMPTETVLQRRDRAVFAFTLLSGARDDAIASMSLRYVDLAKRVDQDARQVRTKARKSFVSWFFPVGDDIESILAEWMDELGRAHLFGPDDPLFPATKIGLGATGHFEALGIDRKHWKDAAAIRKIFRSAFGSAGLPYFNPHSFCHAGRANVPDPGRVQGLEPEFGARACADDLHKLRSSGTGPPGNHLRRAAVSEPPRRHASGHNRCRTAGQAGAVA
jgi:integrase